MSHSADPDELLEVLGDELRPVVRDDPGTCLGKPLANPLNNRLDLSLGHALADLPVDDEPTAAVEQAAEVEERAGDVDVGDVDVPVLVGPQGLYEAFPFGVVRVCCCVLSSIQHLGARGRRWRG